MKFYYPKKVYVDPKALKYPLAEDLIRQFKEMAIPIVNSRTVKIDTGDRAVDYFTAKQTVLLTVNKQKKLQPCKPSADFQFALSSSCPATCEYCYLQTTQGETPVVKLFVNIEEILENLNEYIENNKPNITTFEAASITDGLALEHLCGTLGKTIEFFASREYGRLRVVTKFDAVDSLLSLQHGGHTTFRFTINSNYVISNFEHNTANYLQRIEAARKMALAGYPLGFIVAPIMIYEGWEQEYNELFYSLSKALEGYPNKITFELIQHRYTQTAKELIKVRYPHTKLDMDEEKRMLKWGPYGKFKYVYPKEEAKNLKMTISSMIEKYFDNFEIAYFT